MPVLTEETSINFTKYLKSKISETIDGERIHRYQYFTPCSFTENVTYNTLYLKGENIAKKIHDVLINHFEESSFSVIAGMENPSNPIVQVMLRLCNDDMLLYETLLNNTTLLAIPVEEADVLSVNNPINEQIKNALFYRDYDTIKVEKGFDSSGMLYLNYYLYPIKPLESIVVNVVCS